jgi:hypothetical protein
MVATTNSRAVSGGSFQMTDAIADNRYAAGFLKQRGFAAPIVIGHSTAACRRSARRDHPETPRWSCSAISAANPPFRWRAKLACSAATASTTSRRKHPHGRAGRAAN